MLESQSAEINSNTCPLYELGKYLWISFCVSVIFSAETFDIMGQVVFVMGSAMFIIVCLAVFLAL